MSKVNIFVLSILGLVMTPNSFAQTRQEQRIQQLERKIEALEEQQSSSKSLADKFSVSGFATIAIGMANNDALFAGYTNDQLDLKQDSVFGLQTDFEINESTKATLQLLSRGKDDWELNLQWAFLAHEFDNGIVLRGGKMQVPVYLISDFIEVGYAYPYMRPPLDVYDISLPESYTGVDVSYSFDFDSVILNTQMYFGQDKFDVPGSEPAEMEKLRGIKLGLEWQSFIFGATTARAKGIGLVMPDGLTDVDAFFTGFSFIFDNGQWLITSEYTFTELEDSMPDYQSNYVMFSYNFGQFTPYLALSYLKSTDDETRLSLPSNSLDTNRSVMSLGVRFEIMNNVALKLDWSKADRLKGTAGYLSGNKEYITLPSGGIYPLNTGEYNGSNVYTIAVDVIF